MLGVAIVKLLCGVRLRSLPEVIVSRCGVHTLFLLDNAIDRGSYAAKVSNNIPISWSYTADLRQSILCRDVIGQSAI
jgi:hypothetical protein